MGRRRAQRVTYITERCVIDLLDTGLTVTEIAPGVDIQRDVLDQADCKLLVAPEVQTMDPKLFCEAPLGLTLRDKG
jgi:propionate CoA-transferase